MSRQLDRAGRNTLDGLNNTAIRLTGFCIQELLGLYASNSHSSKLSPVSAGKGVNRLTTNVDF